MSFRVHRHPSLLAGVIACLLSPITFVSDVKAEELDYFDLPLEQLLNAEIVSVSRKEEKVSDAAAAIFVIDQEDIQRSGVTTVPGALRMVPGVQVARADSNSWAISIRGFNGVLANKLLVMVDGRTVYNPLFGGTYWELQDLMLDDIERIEVIRGPGGSQWGANAVNGVISIITKTASQTQGNLASVMYGNQEDGTVEARHGGAFGPDNHYRVYAKYFDRDSFRRPNGDDADDDWQGGRSGFRADWGDDFTLQGDIYRVLTDQLTNTPLTVAPFSIIEKEAMASQGANLLGRWKKDMDDGALWSVQSYIDYTERDQILLKDKRGIFDLESQYNFAPVGRHEVIMGGAPSAAAIEARYFDLSLVPWSAEAVAAQDMAQSLVFGSGLPVVLVPPAAAKGAVDHIAIAWDESRVAARALCDALPLLSAGGHISVLTVQDEKSLRGAGLAQTLAVSLELRGYNAKAVDLTLDGRTIAEVLQDGARAQGAQLLAMGGFGHSRLRDFILGGATKGVFGDLRIPTLLAH